ncbi:MAG: hypothetical protein ACRDOK_11465, partial [Streptosporangiaceae bacterium]
SRTRAAFTTTAGSGPARSLIAVVASRGRAPLHQGRSRTGSGTLAGMTMPAWPLFGLRLHCRGVVLRPVTEADLPHLAAIQPDDY